MTTRPARRSCGCGEGFEVTAHVSLWDPTCMETVTGGHHAVSVSVSVAVPVRGIEAEETVGLDVANVSVTVVAAVLVPVIGCQSVSVVVIAYDPVG